MSEATLPREVRHRVAILRHADEVTGNIAMTCRYYGISRQLFYKWRKRFDDEGIDERRVEQAEPSGRRPPDPPGMLGGIELAEREVRYPPPSSNRGLATTSRWRPTDLLTCPQHLAYHRQRG